MNDTTDFDRLVASWLQAAGPADIRREAIDGALGEARSVPQRRGLRAWLVGPAGWPAFGPRRGFTTLPPVARVALLLALTVSLVLGAVLAGGGRLAVTLVQPSPPMPTLMPSPLGAHPLVLTHESPRRCPLPDGGTTNLPAATLVDPESGTTRQLVDCEAGLLLSPDGLHAVGVATDHLELIDLQSGSRRPIAGTEGLAPEPIAWSPKGTYLYWLADNTAERPGAVFIGPLDDVRRSRLPSPAEGGYFTDVIWSADESSALFQSDDGGSWAIGNGDGTNMRALPAVGDHPFAISPDGARVAVALERTSDTGTVLAVDAAVGDGSGAPSLLTHFPDGTQAIAAGWSPDGSTIAIVSTSRAEPATPAAATSNDLWLVARDGSMRHFALPAADDAVRASSSLRWAADGGHVAIGWHTLRRNAQGQETHTESFTVLAVASGALALGNGWTGSPLERVFFSTDGSRLAHGGDRGLEVVNLDGSGTVPLASLLPQGWEQLVWMP